MVYSITKHSKNIWQYDKIRWEDIHHINLPGKMTLKFVVFIFNTRQPYLRNAWSIFYNPDFLWPSTSLPYLEQVSLTYHYSDVIMGAMASQITSLTIVYSTVCPGADQRKHQSSASLAFVRGIHR